MNRLKRHKAFEGFTDFWEHESSSTGTKMKVSTFTPPGKTRGALIWLSGLTCTEENFITKAGAQKTLADTGMAVICPDTSPRGLDLPHEKDNWDFGVGAGFYVDATTPVYRDHYRMDSYVTRELYSWIESEFAVKGKISISGHSMGGHGALVLGLREPEKFTSISAFSPIVNPMACAWGEKAFTGYLGTDRETWRRYDACELIRAGAAHPRPLWVDQGSDDNFLEKQLLTQNLVKASEGTKQKLQVRMQPGYDHSYYFISTFIADHIRFHAEFV